MPSHLDPSHRKRHPSGIWASISELRYGEFHAKGIRLSLPAVKVGVVLALLAATWRLIHGP